MISCLRMGVGAWVGVHRREPGCRLSGCQGTRVKLAGCPITRVRQIPGWKFIRVESFPGAIYPGAKSCFCIFFTPFWNFNAMLNVKRKSEKFVNSRLKIIPRQRGDTKLCLESSHTEHYRLKSCWLKNVWIMFLNIKIEMHILLQILSRQLKASWE